MKTTLCSDCGKPIEYTPLFVCGREMFSKRTCEACRESSSRAIKEAETNTKMQILRQEWVKLCPADFDTCDVNKLPNPSILASALKWQYGKKGILLAGRTNTGKTRVAWQVLKREHFGGKRCAAMTGEDLMAYTVNLMRDPGAASDWLSRVSRSQVLLADDIFKVKLTERAEEAIFMISDHRIAYRLPMILTTNDTSETLRHRLSADRSEPILRRIVGACEMISL